MDLERLDKIHLRGLRTRCILGVRDDERDVLREVLFNISLYVEGPAAGDDIRNTADYSAAAKTVKGFAESSSFLLIETLAEETAALLLARFPIPACRVVVDKPGVPEDAEGAAVEIVRYNGYVSPMSQSTVHSILRGPGDGRTETVKGWVRTKRESKNITFLEINDGSCLASIQVVVDHSACEEGVRDRILTGAGVAVTGTVVESQGKGQGVELQASAIELIGEAPADYPLQKKRHSFEFLREIAHLRPRTNTFGAVARVRNALSRAVHDFFQSRGFLWIHTPIITGSDAEGAGSMFQVTALDLEAPPRGPGGKVDYGRDFFGKKAHLTVSGQLQAENYASSMGNVYCFGPTFRAENSNTTRHLSEFWMVEPEMAFCDLDGNRRLAEEFIKHLLESVLNDCSEDLEFFDRRIAPGTMEGLRKVADTPFAHLSYSEAIAILEKAPADWEFPPAWGMDLQAEHERYLTETALGGPVAVTDYPKGIKAFYMKRNEDDQTVRAMDLLVPRLGEIIGGSQREDDLDRLENRMREMDMDASEYSWYLDLRRFGSVPHSGFGLGFERLVQYVTGMHNIRDVIPFPRTPKSIAF